MSRTDAFVTYVDALYAHADRTPHAPALVTTGEVVSYRDLADRIERLARRLTTERARPEQVCAIAVPRVLDAVIAMAAVTRAGAAFLTLDVELPPTRLAAMVDSAGARHLLTESGLAQRLALSVPGRTVLLDRPADAPTHPVPPPRIHPRSLAYVSHTSGSTGTPNAVLIEHQGLENYLRCLRRDHGLGPHTAVVQVAPLGYDASIRDIFAPLTAGGRLILVPRATLLRPDGFASAVRALGGNTVLSATPSLLASLAADGAPGLPPLRLVLTSGESLRPFLLSGGRRAVTGDLVNQYGPTECTMTSTRFRVPPVPDTDNDLVGTSVDQVTVQLLDARLRPVPDGAIGEVHIGGAAVARGYGGRPGLTADRFVPDPSGPPGARMYRTGDLARRRPDGNLVYLGRADRQIKIRGYRVDPAEIEGVLLGYPAVANAVVVAETDDRGRTYLVAHLAGELAGVTDRALRAHLARTLPHHMMPRRFVRVARMPTTASGKADRAALRAAATLAGDRPA
ncbi:amino acid adenylation domain-containing protein [Micromonospora sp. NPDC047074]|uniref:amino acid adenylation domain-containing protein n=1 Tax=Micromonospora sp. NPDC047074 TaxID=3154339 RepID=UPI0033CB69CB